MNWKKEAFVFLIAAISIVAIIVVPVHSITRKEIVQFAPDCLHCDSFIAKCYHEQLDLFGIPTPFKSDPYSYLWSNSTEIARYQCP